MLVMLMSVGCSVRGHQVYRGAVAVLAAGSIACDTGQTYAALQDERYVETAWALGERPGPGTLAVNTTLSLGVVAAILSIPTDDDIGGEWLKSMALTTFAVVRAFPVYSNATVMDSRRVCGF